MKKQLYEINGMNAHDVNGDFIPIVLRPFKFSNLENGFEEWLISFYPKQHITETQKTMMREAWKGARDI